jgi:hypothetical protein
MVGGTCRGAAVFSLYFQRRPGGSALESKSFALRAMARSMQPL